MVTPHVLITGANRGLGLEFVRQYVHQGALVFAACRTPSQADSLNALQVQFPKTMHLIEMDVQNAVSILEAFKSICKCTDVLDTLINNAGIFPTKKNPEKLGTLQFETALEVFRVNSVAPCIVTQNFLPLLRISPQARVVNIASDWGSISANTSGFPYYYAASKAALNMLTRSMAVELYDCGVTAISMDPGWVQTDMGGPQADLTPRESVCGMIQVIQNVTMKERGSFLTWEGKKQAW